jgi:hypothetical protein
MYLQAPEGELRTHRHREQRNTLHFGIIKSRKVEAEAEKKVAADYTGVHHNPCLGQFASQQSPAEKNDQPT